MKQHLLSLIALFFIGILFWGSSGSKTFTETLDSYESISRPKTTQHQVDYQVPSVTPSPGVEMNIEYKGVLIRCEIIPIQVTTQEKIQEIAVPVEASQYPQLDMFQIKKIPTYSTSRNNLLFKITLTNRQDRVLKLVDAPIVMLIDGDQYQLSEEVYVDWNNAMVIKGFTKEFTLMGPAFDRLTTVQKIYLSINDVPVEYDKAGNVLEKKNFDWTFDCETRRVQKSITIPLTYETRSAKRESCNVCSGNGSLSTSCAVCGGDGKVGDNNQTACFSCGGDGKKSKACTSCNSQGFHYRPQSPEQRIESSVTWNGWEVEVDSKPERLQVYGYKPKIGQYQAFGRMSNSGEEYQYWATATNANQIFPLKINYGGKMYSFYPFSGEDLAQRSYKVEIDFTQNPPAIKDGFWGLAPEDIPVEKEIPDRTEVDNADWQNELPGVWVYSGIGGNRMLAIYEEETVKFYAQGIEWSGGTWEIQGDEIVYTLTSKTGGSGVEQRRSSITDFKKDVFISVDGKTGLRLTMYRAE